MLSSMSGLIHHEIKTSDEFVEEYVNYLAEENPELIISALYENFDCGLNDLYPDEDKSEINEVCSQIYRIGDEHNTGLRSLMKTMDRMDVKFGESPEKDLLLYDRVILQNGDPQVMEEYNTWRPVHEHSLQLANYNSNQTTFQQTKLIIESSVDNLDSYCGLTVEGIYDSSNESENRACTELALELQGYLSLGVDNALNNGDKTFIDYLQPNPDASPEAEIALTILEIGAHASMSYWACDSSTANLRDIKTESSNRWCAVMDDTRERIAASGNNDSVVGDQESDEREEEATEGRGGNDYENTKLWSEMSAKERFFFILDCIGLAIAIFFIVKLVGAIIVKLGATQIDWKDVGKSFGKLFKYGIKLLKKLKSLFPQHDLDTIMANLQEDCSDGEDNDGDGYVDCDDQDCFNDPVCATQPEPTQPIQKLGELSLQGTPSSVRTYGLRWVQTPEPPNWNSDQWGVWDYGYYESCEYNYQHFHDNYADDRLITDHANLSRSWSVTPISGTPMTPSPVASISQGIGGGLAEFYQEGRYMIIYVESHPDAIDTPQIATTEVTVKYGCDEEVPSDIPGDVVNPSWFSAIQTSQPLSADEKWYESAIRDIGKTSIDHGWLDARSCDNEDWHCIAGTVTAVEHNNVLGSMVDAQHATGIFSPIYSDTYYQNVDAIIIATNNSQIIEQHFETRDAWISSHEKLLKKLDTAPYDSENIAYATLALAIDSHMESGTPAASYQAMKYVHDNWDVSTAHQTYIKQLKLQISAEGFDDLESEVQLSIQGQLAVLEAHNPTLMGDDALSRGDPTGLEDAFTIAEVITEPDQWFQGKIKAARASFKHAERGANSHPGFTGDISCDGFDMQSENDMIACISAKLEENDYFARERTAASANSNLCGEDASLTTLETDLGKIDYKVGDPVQYKLDADCTLNGYEYRIKTEIVDSNGQVVFSDKAGPWEESDNREVFMFDIIDGFDEGTFCVNSMLFENLNTAPISVNTGADCFTVTPAKSSGGKDDKGLPGFAGLTAIIATLGAALIAFRRIEEK